MKPLPINFATRPITKGEIAAQVRLLSAYMQKLKLKRSLLLLGFPAFLFLGILLAINNHGKLLTLLSAISFWIAGAAALARVPRINFKISEGIQALASLEALPFNSEAMARFQNLAAANPDLFTYYRGIFRQVRLPIRAELETAHLRYSERCTIHSTPHPNAKRMMLTVNS